MNEKEQHSNSPEKAKQPYLEPVLVCHGSLADLTKSGSTSVRSDNGKNNKWT